MPDILFGALSILAGAALVILLLFAAEYLAIWRAGRRHPHEDK